MNILFTLLLVGSPGWAKEPVLSLEDFGYYSAVLKIANDVGVDIGAARQVAEHLITLNSMLGPGGRPRKPHRDADVVVRLRLVAEGLRLIFGPPLRELMVSTPTPMRDFITGVCLESLGCVYRNPEANEETLLHAMAAFEASTIPQMQNQLSTLVAAAMTTAQLEALAHVSRPLLAQVRSLAVGGLRSCEGTLDVRRAHAAMDSVLATLILEEMLRNLIVFRPQAAQLVRHLR